MDDSTAGKPLISVIITSYNYLRFIPTAIESARAQTYPNVEIVVVDNCSTDGTVAALRALYGDDPRVHIYENERNIGELLNSNRGFELSTGEFVMWLSADDWMYPQHLTRLHQLFERAPALDVAYATAYFADEGGTVYAERLPEAKFPYDYVDARDELIEMFTTTCPICWPAALFRRAVFLELGLEKPEEGIHATDLEFQIRIAIAGKRFGYIAEPSIAIRIHAEQQTGVAYHHGGRRLTDFLLMIEKYIDHPGMVRLRGREAGMAGFFSWMIDDTIAASGSEVFPPEIYERIATLKRVLEGRAANYQPALVREQTVSVIMPVSRSPVLTGRALASVAQQTFPNWEVVVVDSGAIPLRDWVDALPHRERISYVRAGPGLTASEARNVALRMARGEYLAFLGESNTFAPEHLATLAGTIASSGGKAAATAARLVLEFYDPRFLHIQQVGDVGIYRGPADPPALGLVADALPLDALLVYRSVRDAAGGFGALPFLDDFEFLIRVERAFGIAFASPATATVHAGIDLATLAPALPRYLSVLDAVYGVHAAPTLLSARAAHRAAVERAIATVTTSATIDAQGAADLLATLAGGAARPVLA